MYPYVYPYVSSHSHRTPTWPFYIEFSNAILQVSPENFCDKIWAGDLHYKEHECDFLAAYVAICYTHQICFSWRKSNFCRECVYRYSTNQMFEHLWLNVHFSVLKLLTGSIFIHFFVFLHFTALKCPPGKEYKPCVNTCKTRTCQNRDYYEESTCTSIREECVCKSGTILHRADSAFCVTEDQCSENATLCICIQIKCYCLW